MAGIRIPFISEVRQFLAGTQDMEDALDDVSDSLDELSRDGGAATDRLEDDFRDLADSADRSFDDIRKSARKAGDDIPDELGSASKGGRLKSVGSEIGAEFSENIGEGLRSGDYAGTLEETGTSLAAALGPLGIGVGIGTALVANIIRGVTDSTQKLKDTVERLVGEAWSEGFLSETAVVQDSIDNLTAGGLAEDLGKARELMSILGIDTTTLYDVLAGKVTPQTAELSRLGQDRIDKLNREIELLVSSESGQADKVAELEKERDAYAEALGILELTNAATSETNDLIDFGNRLLDQRVAKTQQFLKDLQAGNLAIDSVGPTAGTYSFAPSRRIG